MEQKYFSHELFQTNAITSKFNQHDTIQKNYIETLDDYKNKISNQATKHHRTFMTTPDIHHNSVFSDLVNEISEMCSYIKGVWCLEDGVKIGISQMWGSITQPGGLLMPHSVPFTFLYGVYFLKTPPNSGNIVFENVLTNPDFYASLPVTKMNTLNTNKFGSLMPEGNIILTPGYLHSHTSINDDDEDRYFIHFALTIVQ